MSTVNIYRNILKRAFNPQSRTFYLKSLITGVNASPSNQNPEKDPLRIGNVGQPSAVTHKTLFNKVNYWFKTSHSDKKQTMLHSVCEGSNKALKSSSFLSDSTTDKNYKNKNRSDIDHDVIPGIPSSVFANRRKDLMKLLPEKSVVVIVGNSLRYVSENIFYPFTQNTEMKYLCGFNSPDAAMVLYRDSSCDLSYELGLKRTNKEQFNAKRELVEGDSQFLLFVKPQLPEAIVWEGKKCGVDEVGYFGANQGYDISLLDKFVNAIPRDHYIFTNVSMYETDLLGGNLPANPRFIIPDGFGSDSIKQLKPILSKQRAFKDDNEINLMKIAGDISGEGHRQIMRFTPVLKNERDIETIFDFSCKISGGPLARQGYVPVVASGDNALVLHYIHNNMLLTDEKLIMIDAGFEYNGYQSDITRTIPRSGKFTEAQKEIYQLVLDIQKEGIEYCSKHLYEFLSLEDIHDYTVELFQSKLSKLFDRHISINETRKLFNHHVGHYVGLDLHDTQYYSRRNPLRDGNVITIEPGVYIPYSDEYPMKYQGIGIRIEDTVLITSEQKNSQGYEVLTKKAPKEISDIENIMCNEEDRIFCKRLIQSIQ